MKGGKGAGGRRTSGQGGWSSAVAPRFERRVVPSPEEGDTPGDQQQQQQQQQQQPTETKHIYYDGELCEAETLPNGFTKIRKDSLDALFLLCC